MLTDQQIDMIRFRSKVKKCVRDFFDIKGYLEVDTPMLSPDLIPEPSISSFSTQFHHEFRGSRTLYLIPSPEVYMKKLLSWGSGSIFQINHCFRNSEQLGHLHNPEFSMLEWYTVDAGYLDSLQLTLELLQALAPLDRTGLCTSNPVVMTVSQACREYAGFALEEVQDIGKITETAASLGLSRTVHDRSVSWEEVFNRIFLTFVEPKLPKDRPCFLLDYPKQISCLAKNIPGTPWKERWELYLGGWELANCFSEEIDCHEVAAYYREAEQELLLQDTPSPMVDHSFAVLYKEPHRACSGTALGLDRLLMALTGYSDIQGVILFPLSDIL